MLHKQAVDHPVPPSHPRTKKMGMIMVNIQTMVVTMMMMMMMILYCLSRQRLTVYRQTARDGGGKDGFL